MKKALLLLVILGLVGGLIFVDKGRFSSHKAEQPSAIAVAAIPAPKPPPPAVAQPPALMPQGEFQRYQGAREAALQANPDLQNKYKDILKKMDSRQAALETAMLKADPQLGPVLAKLRALRAKNSLPQSPSSARTDAAPVTNLTPDDLQELRTARAKAMQSDSDYLASGKKLAAAMSSFEDALDAAMLKTDPTLAPVIAKFEAGRHQPGIATNSPLSK